jgi:O-antigen ligase
MGLLASFLSGTRGAWMAIPVLLVLFLSCRHMLRPRKVFIGGVVIVILFGILLYLPGTHLLQRIEVTMQQTESYLAASHDAGRPGAFPACLDDRAILSAWVRRAVSNHPEGFNAQVDQMEGPDASALSAQGCSRGNTIHIDNKGTEPAWLVLPRYQASSTQPPVARFLLKGTGVIAYQGQGAQKADTHSFMPVTVTGPVGSGGQIALGLYPGQALWFVPVESYYGEYHYPLIDTPIGQRLEMWRAALHLFGEAPVFGVGLGAYQTETGKLVDAGLAAPDSARYDHPHSDFFDALANRGLVGLFALLLLLGVPAWLYARRLESRDPHAMGAALGGLLVVVGYAIFGLTETLFIHSVTIGWYVMMTAVFLVSSKAPSGQDNDR